MWDMTFVSLLPGVNHRKLGVKHRENLIAGVFFRGVIVPL